MGRSEALKAVVNSYRRDMTTIKNIKIFCTPHRLSYFCMIKA